MSFAYKSPESGGRRRCRQRLKAHNVRR